MGSDAIENRVVSDVEFSVVSFQRKSALSDPTVPHGPTNQRYEYVWLQGRVTSCKSFRSDSSSTAIRGTEVEPQYKVGDSIVVGIPATHVVKVGDEVSGRTESISNYVPMLGNVKVTRRPKGKIR